MEVNTYQKKVRGAIQNSFPKADISSILKFSGGLTSRRKWGQPPFI